LGSSDVFESITIAGPGFINFKLTPKALIEALQVIAHEKKQYGICKDYQGKKVLVEFVSANPTGPLHIGHGRNAVVGDTLSRLMQAVGYEAKREYYINDGGIQMMTLGKSVYLRMQELQGEKIIFPENAYQGEYITDLAKDLLKNNLNPVRISAERLHLNERSLSAATPLPHEPIFILDTIGELRSMYSASDIVFVGGSLVKKGGQNPIEPASVSKPRSEKNFILGSRILKYQQQMIRSFGTWFHELVKLPSTR